MARSTPKSNRCSNSWRRGTQSTARPSLARGLGWSMAKAWSGPRADTSRKISSEIFLEVSALGPDHAFAIDQPRPRAKDGLAVDCVPRRQLFEHLFDFGVERAIRPLHDVQQE